MDQGSREDDLLEELIMILVTWSSVKAEKVENIGGRELWVMCCIFSEAENVEHIFSVKNSTNLSAKS